MKKQSWVFLFVIALIANIVGSAIKSESIDYISKPIIVVSLIGYFLSRTITVGSSLKKWIVFALVFSCIGDVLLLFQQKKELFFLLGLSAFLLAHIFYILFFHRVRIIEKIKGNAWLLLIVVIYFVALIVFLSPYLGDKKLPVRIYGIVISFMFMLAMHMLYIKNKTAGRWMVTGALLFVVSDSVLAINKFYQPFEMAGVVIMLTYGLAQFFIVEGAIKYITSKDKE